MPALRPRGADPARRAARIPELDLRERSRTPSRPRRWRRPASPSARAAAPRSSSTPTCTPRNARSAPRRSSPTPGCSRHIKPQAQLPFLLTEDEARAAMNRWLGRLWFAPSNLKALRPRRPGDAGHLRALLDLRRRDPHRLLRPARHGLLTRRTRCRRRSTAGGRWCRSRSPRSAGSRCAGSVARDFDDVLVLGSRSLPKRFTDALAPWDLSALSAYEPRFLAGFRAEGYTVPVEDAYGEARAIMNAGDRGRRAPRHRRRPAAHRRARDRGRPADLQARAPAGLARGLPLPRPQPSASSSTAAPARSRASGPGRRSRSRWRSCCSPSSRSRSRRSTSRRADLHAAAARADARAGR